MRIAVGLFIIATLTSPQMAWAQTAAEREACMGDFEKFCPGVEPGGGRVMECLSSHLNELTQQCQAVVKAHMPK